MSIARILVVDDSPIVVRLLSLMLQEAGFDVGSAADGEEGLFRAREISPDVMLVDAMMPKLDGYQLCAAVRADNSLKCRPYVIILTANDHELHQGEAQEAGVDEFITKPFDPAAVLSRVRALMADIPEGVARHRVNVWPTALASTSKMSRPWSQMTPETRSPA